eukprot:gene1096-1649_t
MDLVELIMEQRRLHSAAKKAVLENGMYIDRATKSVARSPKTCALLGFALLGSYLALHQLETLSEKVSLASKHLSFCLSVLILELHGIYSSNMHVLILELHGIYSSSLHVLILELHGIYSSTMHVLILELHGIASSTMHVLILELHGIYSSSLHVLMCCCEVGVLGQTAGSGDSDSDKQQIPPEEMQEEPAATASELTQAVSGTGDVQSRLPLTFALFFIGDATGRNGQWLGAVLQNIRKHHPNRQRFPIVILTDERTKFGALPGTIGVELRRQAHAKQEGVPDAYRYLYRAMAERSVLQEALDQGRPTHAIFLDATDIIVRRSLVPLFKEQAGHEFGLALTYRPPRGKASGNSLAATQPVNLGVKAVSSCSATRSLSSHFGGNANIALGLKVHGWALQKGVEIYTTFIETYKQNYIDQNRTYGLDEQSSIMDVLKRSTDYSRRALWSNKKMFWKVEYARVHMLNCKEWNCLMNFAHPKACASSRIQHFKESIDAEQIQLLNAKMEAANAANEDLAFVLTSAFNRRT